MPDPIPRVVVGAIIVDDLASPDVVLAARRHRPAELAGLWEFPGGKIEEGETSEAALVRELHEELGVWITVGPEFPHPDGAWPISDRYELRLFFAAIVDGEVNPGESHDEVTWLSPSDLSSVHWLPSDAAAIKPLQDLLLRTGQQQPRR